MNQTRTNFHDYRSGTSNPSNQALAFPRITNGIAPDLDSSITIRIDNIQSSTSDIQSSSSCSPENTNSQSGTMLLHHAITRAISVILNGGTTRWKGGIRKTPQHII
ncbi:hypothetical protein GOP47_0002201 [Adiantum capillus-veneris]|uniref:Uncharacterized protein n=1 Tax=Adiantum capillus-veneris TaxID=13818 RepID=A0A9D4VBA6_ADICA|nr:hypothetical protein GOP47_0002201 [Adiantum capillus-veneris]